MRGYPKHSDSICEGLGEEGVHAVKGFVKSEQLPSRSWNHFSICLRGMLSYFGGGFVVIRIAGGFRGN